MRLRLCALALLPIAASAQPAFPLHELMARLAQPTERHAQFTEDKHFSALTSVLHSSGTLAFARPAHLEKLTLAPSRERLTVDGDRLVIDAGDAPQVVDLGGQPALRALVDTIRGALSGDLAALQRSYTILGTGTLDDWRLTLHPSAAMAPLVQEVVITGGADIRTILSVLPNGDTDQLTIIPSP